MFKLLGEIGTGFRGPGLDFRTSAWVRIMFWVEGKVKLRVGAWFRVGESHCELNR